MLLQNVHEWTYELVTPLSTIRIAVQIVLRYAYEGIWAVLSEKL